MALLCLSSWATAGGLHSDLCHFLKGHGGIGPSEKNQKSKKCRNHFIGETKGNGDVQYGEGRT